MGIFEIASTAIAGLSLVLAVIAVRQSSKANSFSEQGNQIALEARSASDTANQIATDANAISMRALAYTENESAYRWNIEYDREEGICTAINYSNLLALEVSIFVVVEGFPARQIRYEKFPINTPVVFNVKELSEDHAAAAVEVSTALEVSYFREIRASRIVTIIVWSTPSGTHHTRHFTHEVN
ncbi:hypothetical protein [Arcanobacterium haemolyticum]